MCVCVCSFWTSLPLMSSDSQAKMKPQSASRWGKSDQGQGDVQTVVYRYKCCQWLLLALKEEHDTAELKKYSTGSEWRRMCAHLMSLQDIHVFVSLFTSRWMESLSPHSLSQCALSHRRPWGRDKLCLTVDPKHSNLNGLQPSSLHGRQQSLSDSFVFVSDFAPLVWLHFKVRSLIFISDSCRLTNWDKLSLMLLFLRVN